MRASRRPTTNHRANRPPDTHPRAQPRPGSRGVARVPDSQIADVVDAATECPGECIMIEPYDADVMANRGA